MTKIFASGNFSFVERIQYHPDGSWAAPPDLVARQIRGELLMVPIRRSSDELDGFFTLNSVAADIWRWASEGKSFFQLIELLVREYDVSRVVAERDIANAVEEFVKAGLLIKRVC